ncbi:kinase [Paenibacillus athensensis]|uniref:Kinase n=1 Tax=Paenibacillus athensensis TaxID=1967502 RepID=A0A4Y8QAY0_9BACL|nr:sporulation phosphorelay system protein KapB [Paenibacillus athensensis]MCD1257486.1 kinase [Paenibacillus athensensis]
MNQWQAGELVTAAYKTGVYIGEIVEMTSPMKAAVKVLAVAEHPTQGDLHQPMDGAVSFFHQRRALSHQEIALMPVGSIKSYSGTVPDYRESLKRALAAQIAELSNMQRWSERSLQELEQLSKEYFPSESP